MEGDDGMRIRIGTRKSRLAMVQTELVRDVIKARFPEMEIELVPMSTKGDKLLDRSLASFGGKGVFTRELEEALLEGKVDLAVHSAKDMPMEFPKGLALGAVLERADPRDVLVTVDGRRACEMPAGSVIGTSSLRRELQIRDMNPQVQIKVLRGNVQTRLEKLKNGEYDGILLAAAGLERLGLTGGNRAQSSDVVQNGIYYMEYLPEERFIPAPGQGILAVEIREGELADVMEAIHSTEASVILRAERELIRILGGGCNAPCGAYCRNQGGVLEMKVMYARDGIHPAYWNRSCTVEEEHQAELAAEKLAREMAGLVRLQRVSLVGAGPGDAGLFTQKGLSCVRRGDVIVYDNLISGSILNEARLDAELIYAGKRSDDHHMTQEQINALLVKLARQGKYVVRLKGGDPYIFGRGGEEALELKKNGIPFEIVPGVSSSYSVPAYAGIPVTQRELASSFHVITGHEGGHKEADVLDYGTLAREEGTLIFLMGLRNLERIAGALIAHGKPKETPAAVIQQGTTARQKKAVSTLEHIVEEVKQKGIRTPAITVVGDVVSLETKLDWFLTGPLAGTRVLVTGTRRMARELEAVLSPLGAETVAVSIIESRPLETELCEQVLENLADYSWLVFTSGNGVELFFSMLRERKIDLRCLMGMKFAAVGEKTGAELMRHGFGCDFTPSHFSSECMAEEWIPSLTEDDKVLMMRAKDGSPVLPMRLAEAGISYTDVPLYETWVDERRGEELNRAARDVDYIVVASGSAVRALCRMLKDRETLDAKVISIGPSTTKEAEKLGLKLAAGAAEYTAKGIAAAILTDRRDSQEDMR